MTMTMYIERNGSEPDGSICASCRQIIPPGDEVVLEIDGKNNSPELNALKGNLYHPKCAKPLQSLVRAHNSLSRGMGF